MAKLVHVYYREEQITEGIIEREFTCEDADIVGSCLRLYFGIAPKFKIEEIIIPMDLIRVVEVTNVDPKSTEITAPGWKPEKDITRTLITGL